MFKVCDIIEQINQFYFRSFKMPAGECLADMNLIIESLILVSVKGKIGDELQNLHEVFTLLTEAMKKKDIVLVRDYLFYEIKPFLQKISSGAE